MKTQQMIEWYTGDATASTTCSMTNWGYEFAMRASTVTKTASWAITTDFYDTGCTDGLGDVGGSRWATGETFRRQLTTAYVEGGITYVRSGCYEWSSVSARQQSPAERLRDIIAGRNAPGVVRNVGRNVLPHTDDEREHRARETLRRVIGEDRFSRFLRDGFISVRGKDGFNYQIFPGHGMTCVFDKGRMVERLCVVLNGSFPPTDSMIMRYLMILNNPAQFRSFAITHKTYERKPAVIQPFVQPHRSLAEIYRDILKKAA